MQQLFSPIISLLGLKGIIALTGIMVFVFIFKRSRKIFEWIENNTLGTRNYVLEKLDLLFLKINPDHVTYALLSLSFVPAVIAILILGSFSYWTAGIVVAIILSLIGWRIPRPFIDYLVQRRIKKYEGQIVDGLTLLSNGIRAGLSVPQALGMVVSEMPKPISEEFGLILQQNKIGVPLEDCFDNLVIRVPTEDNDMFVSSVNILRETGGNLSEVFDTIVSVVRERIRLKQKIDSATAQGRFQGLVIFLMPYGVGAMYFATDPKTMIPLFTTPIGFALLLAALVLDFIGGFIILKIVNIKI